MSFHTISDSKGSKEEEEEEKKGILLPPKRFVRAASLFSNSSLRKTYLEGPTGARDGEKREHKVKNEIAREKED